MEVICLQDQAFYALIQEASRPSYPPNLNLIERLWKFVKKKYFYSKYYENFFDFKKTIRTFLRNLEEQIQN